MSFEQDISKNINFGENYEFGDFAANSKTTREQLCCLSSIYPALQITSYGRSVMGKPLWLAKIGTGSRRLLFSASHHGNEWVSTWVLMRFITQLCQAAIGNDTIYNVCAHELLKHTTIFLAPLVNPDGVDLAAGIINSGKYYEKAKKIASYYPELPFPEGWKSNIKGIDLNLQYPASWRRAKAIKEELGYKHPAPQNYVGKRPLCAPESLALADLTYKLSPALILALHSQGEVIYWKYGDLEPYGSAELCELLSQVSGYAMEETPAESGNAGYKDWFIKEFDRPGYTVELGMGQNPLPVEQFEKIYSDVLPLLVCAAIGGSEIA